MYWLGQICGLLGTGITILQPQFQKKTQILICTILVNGLNAVNFACLGQFGSSVFLCLVAIFQSLASMRHVRRSTVPSLRENLCFLLLYLGFGFCGMSEISPLELLPILGALMLMLSIFAKREQTTRIFLLLNSAAWLIYTAAIGSTTFFTSVVSIVSATVALWKYRCK